MSIEITDNQGLYDLCQEMQQQEYLAMDTEFIRERTYYPVLALIQISWKEVDSILIDPLGIDDWEPFHDVLKNPEILKIFHAGRQDLEIFYHQMGEIPANLFDTQIAASMCGYGDQIGYGALVAKLLGVQLAKGSSYTNWLQRPLTDAQMRYARDDVLYLPDVYDKLMARATSKKRVQWVREEMKVQLHEGLFDPDPMDLWRRVKKAKSIKDRDTSVLQELTIWRDGVARRINKPVRFILTDEAMVELCKVDKLTMESLKSRRGLQSGVIDRYGADILERHARGRAVPRAEWPKLRDNNQRPPSEKSEALADLAWLLIKEIATRAHMAPPNLIAKRDLPYFIEAYLRGKDLSKFSISSGWRKEMVSDILIKLIEGEIVIRVQDQKIIWQEQI